MCTAITYQTKDFYFGRTLDIEFSFGETVTVTPRCYPFQFRNGEKINRHNAIIGIAHVAENYPLYYDAVNEKGLCIAGLNFVGNAVYGINKEKENRVAQFELIPWILAKCDNAKEAVALLEKTDITGETFSKELQSAQLHWLLADKNGAYSIESTSVGLKIHNNPVGVLTNNPPFDRQLFRLNDYMSLSPKEPCNNFSSKLSLNTYSRGMGALGLPGDLSSTSRFIRASFVKLNSVSAAGESESVNQFFHVLGSVCQPRGCCDLGGGKYEITRYSSCCNAVRGIYYYSTYENSRITAVSMHNENINGSNLINYKLNDSSDVYFQN